MYQCIQVISQYYPLSSVIRLMSYSRYFCLFTHSGVQHILCCVIVCFHHLLYPMLPVSLDCVLLFVFIIFCIQCCQFLWIVCFWLFSSSSVSNVASFSGLCVFDCPNRYSLTFIYKYIKLPSEKLKLLSGWCYMTYFTSIHYYLKYTDLQS
jgi:hypothetical protein